MRIGLIAVTALGAVCAFLFLDAKSLSYDEGISLWFAQLDWSQLWESGLRVDPLIVPYYALLHIWSGLFGTSSFAARSLSATFAVATIPVIFFLTCQLLDRRTAFIAALLSATSSFWVTYAQDARAYGFEIFASSLSLLAFTYFLARPNRRSAAGYLLASVGAIYLHFFAIFSFAAQLISLPLLQPGRRRYAAAVAGIAAALTVLCIPLAQAQLRVGRSQVAWIPPADVSAVWLLLLAFTGSSTAALLFLMCDLLLLMPFAHVARRGVLAALGLWIAIPIAGIYVLSILHPAFVSRYLACVFPAFIILTAAGITSLRWRAGSYALTALAVALSVQSLWTNRYSSTEDFRKAVAFTSQSAGPRDAVIVLNPAAIYAFSAELLQSSAPLRAPIIYPSRAGPFSATEKGSPAPSELKRGSYDHVWVVLVYQNPASAAGFVLGLGPDYQPGPLQQFTRLSVQRFDRR